MQEMKRIRKEQGLSQQALADRAGVNKVTVNHIEQGKGNPSLDTLEKLAAALEIEIGDLFPKAQGPLPFETERAEEVILSAYINERTTDIEEWAYGFHKGEEPGELPEREFLAYIGGVSIAADEFRRIKWVLESLYEETGEPLSEEIGRAWRRLQRAMLAMVTAGVEERAEQLETGTLPDNVADLRDRMTA